jgi:hypothetical protein
MTDGNADNDQMTKTYLETTSAFNIPDLINCLETYQDLAREKRGTKLDIITADDLNILLEKAELIHRVKRSLSISEMIGKDELYEWLD